MHGGAGYIILFPGYFKAHSNRIYYEGVVYMLNCETNTPSMERRILSAARRKFHQRKNLHTVFEHGQWYIVREGIGGLTENYSVCDASGIGTIDGFDFELL